MRLNRLLLLRLKCIFELDVTGALEPLGVLFGVDALVFLSSQLSQNGEELILPVLIPTPFTRVDIQLADVALGTGGEALMAGIVTGNNALASRKMSPFIVSSRASVTVTRDGSE